MKKFKLLFVLLLAILAIPFITYAEGEEETTDEETVEVAENSTEESEGENENENDSNEVTVYFFRGEGCSHCAEASEWFQSIEEEYGSLFKIVDYETWYDEGDNQELMDKVAEYRGEEASGVPYIIIGNKSWNGFTDSYKDEMINEIKSEYEKAPADRYDIMKYLNSDEKKSEDSSSDFISLFIILIITGGVCFGVYKARNNTN